MVAFAALTLALTGCGKAATKAEPPASAPASSSTTGSSSTVTTAPATATAAPTLGGQCDDLLPVSAVSETLGRPVIGQTSFVLGVAEPDIGRLTYLNCRYGLGKAVRGKPAPPPQLEIGISLYKSADQAARRARGTVDDYVSHGARQIPAAVGDVPATILAGYGNPTLVAADGPRTVAVTAVPPLIATAPTVNLVALAKAALGATSGFAGVVGVTATPSPTGTAS